MAIYRTIHTMLYSNKAENIIKGALHEVGEREVNFSSMPSVRTARHAIVNRAPNGEIVVEFNDNTISHWRLVSYVKKENDIEARKWLAWMIKDCVYDYLNKNGDNKHNGWNRKNNESCSTLANYAVIDKLLIKDAYCIYDVLLGRKSISRKYDETSLQDMIGSEADPFKTEMEVHRRDEVKKINEEYSQKISAVDISHYSSEIRKQMENEIVAIREKYEKLSADQKTQLTNERNLKIKELNDQFSAMAMI